MKNNLLFYLFLLLIIPAVSIAAEMHTIEVEFSFSAPDNSSKQLLGYRLYQEAEQVCETNDPSASRVDCELLTEDGTFDFTLTAHYSDNSESPPSPSFPFTIVSETPPPAPLQAVITPTQTTGKIPLNISFAGTDSTGDIVSYTWDFGDGASSTSSDTSHSYVISGTYTVILSVVDQDGETHQASTTITAQPNTSSPEPPTAVLSSSATVGNTPLTVTFNGTDSTTPYSPITSYSWTFGDGSLANGEATSHTFTTAGTYYTQLTVVDSQGLSDTVSTPIIVNEIAPQNEKPIAVISANSASTAQPLQLSIISVAASTYSRSSTPENTLDNDLSTRWSAYGDGQWIEYDLGSENLISHLLIAFYRIQKTTFDIQVSSDRNSWNTVFSGTNSGLTLEQEQFDIQETTGRYVRIVGHGRTDSDWNSFTEVDIVGFETASTPFAFSFDGLKSSDPDGSIVLYSWDFGDGTTGSGQTVQHTYTRASTYTVSLQVTDDKGATATSTREVVCSSNPDPDNAFNIEIGTVSIDNEWVKVLFENTFNQPVVIASPPSINGTDPAVVRIRNIDQEGFEICMQEWDYLDQTHPQETVSYIVIEKGAYTLDDGTMIEAGSFTASTSFQQIDLQQTYNVTPVILTQVMTKNGNEAIVNRLNSINQISFNHKIQEQETTQTEHDLAETIGYIAGEPGQGEVLGILFEIGNTTNSVTHAWFDLTFETNFPDLPFFFADMQTYDGGDTAALRTQNLSQTASQIMVEEEQSSDSETSHTTEVVGYFTIGTATD